MFVVLYGLTGEIGHQVRAHYVKNGFKKLEKHFYSSTKTDAKRLQEDGCHILSTPEEVKKLCDYSYKVNQRVVGFNKKDFDRAANGGEDVFTSVACSDIGFLKELKADYGSYVTLIYVYIDDATLEKAIKSKYSKSEHADRLATGRELKQIYLENTGLFDSVVLYGGENSVFNKSNLLAQLDVITERAKNAEIELNSKRKVALPYVGPKDYIFISYAHSDKKAVMEKLRVLQRKGFRIWYDSGMRGGDNWRMVLREKIKNAANFIVFTSSHSIRSEDVKIEIVTADAYERKIINIRMDDSSFKGTVGNIVNNLHAVDADSATFEKEMISCLEGSTRVIE